MWGEKVDSSNFFPRAYPRVSAAAEKLWTGNRAGAMLTVRERMNEFRCLLLDVGFDISPLGPGTCELRRSSRGQRTEEREASVRRGLRPKPPRSAW